MFALRESGEGRDHARNVAVYVNELLAGNDMTPDELDAVAVGRGPGSYTGLRIGVSFAKGMCYALGIPLIAVGSLESLAYAALEEHEAGILDAADWNRAVLCPMIDARRMEVYAQVFDTSAKPLTEVAAEVVDTESFGAFIGPGHEFLIFGDGAAKCAEVLPRKGVRLIDIAASARGLCAEAQRKFDAGETEDIAYFEPFYLKDFVVTAPKKKVL
jgi:tRNA threonylcarbamoyladenosine biosynthesis protein TsaB